MILVTGIILGFLCAIAHSLCYIFTRQFLVAGGRSTLQLLNIGHIYMGVISLALLPLCWREPEMGWENLLWPLLAAAGFYFLAQCFFFLTIKFAPASRISPLLGVKIIFLAVFATIFTGEELGFMQWLAVGLCLSAALVLSRSGSDKLPMRILLACLLTTCFYASSDIGIRRMLTAISAEPSFGAATFALCLNYLLCAIPASAGQLLKFSRGNRADWRDALPFSLSWYAAMVFLFGAIAFLGVVPAIIIQSTRGPLSIGLGLLIARLGHHHLEQRIIRADAVRYLAAALLMCASIALYFVK